MPDDLRETAALKERVDALDTERRFATQERVVDEALETARRAQDLGSTISFLFTAANGAWSTCRPRRRRAKAIELATILESEDVARRVQPDLDPDEYEQCRYWYTSCAYDNLAHAAGAIGGYNSEGMFAAVGAGIEKCRQTGKTECITCFREYGGEVSMASDDLDMAWKQGHGLAHRDVDSAPHDRRCVGWELQARVHLVRGELAEAIRCFERATEVAETWFSPDERTFTNHLWLQLAHALAGTPEAYEAFAAARPSPAPAPPGEWYLAERLAGLVEAVQRACAGDPAGAAELLVSWSERDRERSHLAHWFEDRCLLAAAYAMAGDDRLADTVRGTRVRATQARDWLTLSRLRALEDERIPVNPYASVAAMESGPFAVPEPGPAEAAAAAAVAAAAGGASAADGSAAREPDGADGPRAQAMTEWMRRAEDEDEAPIIDEVWAALEALDVSAFPVDQPSEAAAVITTAVWCARAGRDPKALQDIARPLAKGYPEAARVQVALARLVNAIRLRDDVDLRERPPASEVAQLFRRAIALDAFDAESHVQAGRFFESIEDASEAERCFARAFRLDRTDVRAVAQLAGTYGATDRAVDALDVLDLAIRHGVRAPELVYRAAITAWELGRWQACLTYFDLLLSIDGVEAEPWTHYYRAQSLLELDRWEETLTAVELERARNPKLVIALAALRAAALAKLERFDEVAPELEIALAARLGDEPLSLIGLTENLEKLRVAAIAAGHPDLAEKIVARALRSGAGHGDYYYEIRKDRPSEEVLMFDVLFVQEVPADWSEHPDSLPEEAGRSMWLAAWGVMAPDEEAAVVLARAEQEKCAPGPFTLLEVVQRDGRYEGQVGVIGQGAHRSMPGEDDDEDSGEEE